MAASSEAWDREDVGRGGVEQPAAVEPSAAAGSAVPQPAVEDVGRGGVEQSDSAAKPDQSQASAAKPAPFETQTPSDDYCKAYAQAIELLLGSGAQADQVEVEAREMAMMAVQERAQRKLRLASMD